MKTICFWLNHLGERGMCVSTFDYAIHNESILHNKSIILYNKEDPERDVDVLKRFTDRFECFECTREEIDTYCSMLKCDLLYMLKHGQYDDLMNFTTKTAVHAVFEASQPHGDIFAVISSDVNNALHTPIVPHMIHLPEHEENMREELGIPEDALVFGRHGGFDQFNMHYVQHVVHDMAINRPKTFFVFMNTRPFCEPLPNIIHLDKTINLHRKTAFINTCDAMIWGRSGGETFGLSIGEFSSRNKPVFCMDIGSRAHINILGDKAVLFDDKNLYFLMLDFIDHYDDIEKRDWNAYRDFTPERVMHIFNKVFIDTD